MSPLSPRPVFSAAILLLHLPLSLRPVFSAAILLRHLSLAFLFLLLSSPLLAASVAPYPYPRIFWDTASRRTVFSSGGYARLIQLQDGRLMAVCEHSGIDIAFSSNMGKTWTAAKRIVTNTNNTPNCVPDLIQLHDGTIVVGYNPRPSEPYTEDRRFGIRCKRSTDNGRSWSDEIFVNDASYTFQDGCWEPAFLQLPSGELHLYFADEGPYTTNGDQQISLCRSFDGGQTWTKAQKICYRQGFRDGMPVPILLQPAQEIVVAIEDNGWGYGDFLPTTVRTTLQNNWQNYWVSATDKNRDCSLNFDFCPVATGGAPYLRQLPSGETVISHQSPYANDGKIQMRVAVGNNQARDFRAVSTPFGEAQHNPQGLWNSLAVIDTGVVVAVSGIGGKIEMIKGYPTRQLHAAFGHPAVDGRLTLDEGYTRPDATQILLGTDCGTRVVADFAYDLDSLYFIANVFDNTPATGNNNPDLVTLLLEVEGSTETAPQPTSYKLQLRAAGSFLAQRGQSRAWRRIIGGEFTMNLVAATFRSNYVVEAAIPWSALGCQQPPIGARMAAAIEVTDNRDGTVLHETIPDVDQQRPWTWMELRLQPLPDGIHDIPQSNSQSLNPQILKSLNPLSLSGHHVSSSLPAGIVIIRRPDGTIHKLWNSRKP